MRNAIKAIINVKFLVILVVIQFSIGIYMINTASITGQDAKSKKENLNRLFNIDTTYLVDVYGDISGDPVEGFPKVRTSYDEMKKLKKEGLIKNIFLYYGGGVNPVSFSGEVVPDKYEGTRGRNLAMIMLNEDFYKNYGLNIIKGRGFTTEDFKVEGLKQNIPIILGEDYINIVNIGDVFKHSFPNFDSYDNIGVDMNFEVIGFYKHNDIPLLGNKGEIMSQIMYSDSFGIFPIVEDITAISYEPMISQFGAWIDVGDNRNLDTFINRLQKVANKEQLNVGVYSPKDEFMAVSRILSKNIYNSQMLGISLTILAVIGVTAIMAGRIEERKREFGIKVATGATKKNIMLEVLFENMLLCISATLIALLLIYINYQNYISFDVIVNNFIITIIIIIIVSVIPIIKIKRLNVVDLIRG